MTPSQQMHVYFPSQLLLLNRHVASKMWEHLWKCFCCPFHFLTLSNMVWEKCVPYPIAAKIGNVSLSNGQFARGIPLSVGTPQQEFAFLPQWVVTSLTFHRKTSRRWLAVLIGRQTTLLYTGRTVIAQRRHLLLRLAALHGMGDSTISRTLCREKELLETITQLTAILTLKWTSTPMRSPFTMIYFWKIFR